MNSQPEKSVVWFVLARLNFKTAFYQACYTGSILRLVKEGWASADFCKTMHSVTPTAAAAAAGQRDIMYIVEGWPWGSCLPPWIHRKQQSMLHPDKVGRRDHCDVGLLYTKQDEGTTSNRWLLTAADNLLLQCFTFLCFVAGTHEKSLECPWAPTTCMSRALSPGRPGVVAESHDIHFANQSANTRGAYMECRGNSRDIAQKFRDFFRGDYYY